MLGDVIELSSDNESCVSENKNEKACLDSDTSTDVDLTEIINKYSSLNTEKASALTLNVSSDSDDNLSDINRIKQKLRLKYGLDSDLVKTAPDIQENFNEKPEASKPKRPKTSNEEKLLKKIQLENEKAQKREEKQRLKLENDRVKAEKRALAAAHKNVKPEECLKFMHVLLDSNLVSRDCGKNLEDSLRDANIKFSVVSNLLPDTIMWSRNQLTTMGGKLQLTEEEENCNDVLLVMIWNDFASLVRDKKLSLEFGSKILLLPDKKIHLGIYGLEHYFRRGKKETNNGVKISRHDVDTALIELQILYGVSHRLVETPADVNAMVLQFSKSIAQIPYKLQKQANYEQMEWFVSGDNKDCVRVDKNGNGLSRLWQQQLTQFHLARLETAEAITNRFPTPALLIQAYEECSSKEEGEKLLQEIPVRRAAGPLTSVRKIGPELSKKIYTLFTSCNGDTFL